MLHLIAYVMAKYSLQIHNYFKEVVCKYIKYVFTTNASIHHSLSGAKLNNRTINMFNDVVEYNSKLYWLHYLNVVPRPLTFSLKHLLL